MNSDIAAPNPFHQHLPTQFGKRKIVFPNRTVGSTPLGNNDYLDKLNKSLKSELNTLQTYSSLQTSASQPLNRLTSNHLKSIDVLSHLIIKNRGIPDKTSGISGHMSKIMLQLTSTLPHALHKSAAETTLSRLECGLKDQYEKIYELSPIVDHPALMELKSCSQQNIETYRLLLTE